MSTREICDKQGCIASVSFEISDMVLWKQQAYKGEGYRKEQDIIIY